MNPSRLNYLFQVYFDKSATSRERDELMQLLAQSENDEQLKLLLSQTWQKFDTDFSFFSDTKSDEMLAGIFKEAANRAIPDTRLHKRKSKLLRTAMAAAMLLLAFGAIYYLVKSERPVKSEIGLTKMLPLASDSIVPGGNKATLTLADGSNILLDSTRKGNLASQGNVNIVNVNASVLTYNPDKQISDEVVYNTLSTSNGGQYQLVLSDGTRVWLNAFSSIRFPTIFQGKERSVTVTGEAYFEVFKNSEMPFTINVREVQVQVLGTHFNIMAYEDESSINTSLLEGSVKISQGAESKLLTPGQQSRTTPRGDMKIVEADMEEVLAWKNGWFQFDAYDIKKVMRQVSRWYNVEVFYEGKTPTGHFTGVVSRENNISQVLKIMEAGDVGFRIEGRKITVYQSSLK